MDRVEAMMADLGRRDFHYTVHVSPELRFIYFGNPIAACSTLKASLNRSTALATGVTPPPLVFADIHKRDRNILLSPRDMGLGRFRAMLDDPGVLKFSFVREPEARLRSVFGKKLMREPHYAAQVRAHLGRGEGAPLPEVADLDAFAAALAADPTLRDLNEHWRLQRKQVFWDHVPELVLGRVERFADDAARIFGRIFGPGNYEIVDAVGLSASNSSRGERIPPLGPAGRAALSAAYAGDYAMLEELEALRAQGVESRAEAAGGQAPRRGAKGAKRRPPEAPPAETPAPAGADAPAPSGATAPLQTRAASADDRPELILHLGMGKTGTSAVQAALAAAGEALAAQRVAYLGMWFPLAGVETQGWAANAAFLRLQPETLARHGAAFAEALLARAARDGTRRFVLSNESLIGAAPAMAAFLAPLGTRLGLRGLAWARDPAGWLPSAYAQWAIRDKTVAGEIEPYPRAARRLVRRYQGIVEWATRLPQVFELRPYGRETDIVADFAAAAGLTLPPAAGRRVYERLEPAELILRARFNGALPGAVGPEAFDRAVGAPLSAAPPLPRLVAAHLDYGATEAILAENADLFARIAALTGLDLTAGGEAPPEAPALPALRGRLLDGLIGLALDQARRLAELEARLARLEGRGRG